MKTTRRAPLLRRRRSLGAIATVIALTATLAACSSATGSDDSDSGGGTASVTHDEMQVNLDKFTAKPTTIGITEPLKALPTGKRVGWVGNGTPADLAAYETFQEAADLLGLEVISLAGTTDTQATVAAIEDAKSRDLDAIVLNGVFFAGIGPQLTALHDSGVKVLGYALSLDTFTAPNIDFAFYPNPEQERMAALMADYIVLHSDGPAHVLVPYIPDVAAGVAQVDGFKARIKQTCPECSVETLDFAVTQIGSALPGRVVSAFEANPNLNAIYAIFGAAFVGVPEALKQSGRDDVIGASSSGVPLNLQQIQAGQILQASVDLGLGYRGYMLADAAARLLNGQEVPTDNYEGFDMPVQVHTKDNLDFDITQPWEGAPDDYKAQFKEIWGL